MRTIESRVMSKGIERSVLGKERQLPDYYLVEEKSVAGSYSVTEAHECIYKGENRATGSPLTHAIIQEEKVDTAPIPKLTELIIEIRYCGHLIQDTPVKIDVFTVESP